jgi:hypothetical protein
MPMRSPISPKLCLAAAASFSLLAMATSRAQSPRSAADDGSLDGGVWCGVFLAKSSPAASPPEKQIAGLVSQLGKAFPEMGNFELVGESTSAVYKEYECWLVPSKQLFLKLDSLGPQPGESGVHLHVQLWQQKHVILKTDAILRQRPVFIAGPKWGDGRLVMVLKLADHPTASPH